MPKGKAVTKTYLVEVMPLAKGGRQSALSYFSSVKPAPGTLVNVPMRNGQTKAVVLSSRSALSAKSDIRQAAFALRKIAEKNIFDAGLSAEFLAAVEETALYYATAPSTLLASLLPKMLLEEPEHFFQPLRKGKLEKSPHPEETFLLQMEPEERFGQYRAVVRQSFARRKSVLFVVPTHLDALKAEKLLSQGIREYAYVFTLREKRSEAKKIWMKALNEKHPVLFITTPAGLAFERPDLDTIIMERENSRAWRTFSRPYIHFKVFIEKLAKATGRQLVLGDSVLSLEALWREKSGDYGELSLIRWRLPAAPAALVDASTRADTEGKFSIFSNELRDFVKKALEDGGPMEPGKDFAIPGKIFLFGVRKGLAPSTVCSDCGLMLPCFNCEAPVVLHKQKDGTNIYLCHACGTKRDAGTVCGFCGSWRLVPLGIGIEGIAAEAKALFPNIPIEILDKDHAPSDSKAASIAKRFNESGGILVGTELALFHLDKVPYTALVSADALFSIPDFGVHEKIFYLVSRLREMTEKETLIQTRNIGKQVLAWATFGNIIDFYQSEIEERRALLYPPFSVFIKIASLSIKAAEMILSIKERFSKWHPDSFKDSLILRIPKGEWPEPELARELALLGPEFSIKVDPESIL